MADTPGRETRGDLSRRELLQAAAAGAPASGRSVSASSIAAVRSGGYIIPYFPPVIDGYTARVQGAHKSKTGLSFDKFDFKNMWFS